MKTKTGYIITFKYLQEMNYVFKEKLGEAKKILRFWKTVDKNAAISSKLTLNYKNK